MERAIAVDKTASVLGSLWDVRFWTSSGGGVGVETEASASGTDLRNRGMMKVGDKIDLATRLAT